jgi:hypothetical protein
MKQDLTGPIFIVGMNGSGTTMLADALNHHPQIYIHRIESRVIPYYCQQLGTFGDIPREDNFRKLVDDFANNYAFRVCNYNNFLFLPLVRKKLFGEIIHPAMERLFLTCNRYSPGSRLFI